SYECAWRATQRPWCQISTVAGANLICTVVPGGNGAEYALILALTRRWSSRWPKLTSTRSKPSLCTGSRCWRSMASASPMVWWRPPSDAPHVFLAARQQYGVKLVQVTRGRHWDQVAGDGRSFALSSARPSPVVNSGLATGLTRVGHPPRRSSQG